MKNIQDKLDAFKDIVIKNIQGNENFPYREWFIDDHLMIVERIALELCDIYPDADRNLVEALVWFHDFGKPIDMGNEYETTKTRGVEAMRSIGFEEKFIERVLELWVTMEKEQEIDISKEAIEVQIICSADGASHFTGLFYSSYFRDERGESLESIKNRIRAKIRKDWEKKMVLPEIKKTFEKRYIRALEIVGEYPNNFIV
ncbi:MAG: HD domain-containing protein [Parcubacteria group bacterium]